MRKAIYAGSFDPITTGHEWVIKQAYDLFDYVDIVVAHNPAKQSYFSITEKQQSIQHFIDSLSLNGVSITFLGNEYVASYARSVGADYLVRGVRNVADFEYERNIEKINKKINPDLNTIYFTPPDGLGEVSSSMIKGLVGFPGWKAATDGLINEEVRRNFLAKLHYEEFYNLVGYLTNNCVSITKTKEIFNRLNGNGRYYHDCTHVINLLKLIRDDSILNGLHKDCVSELAFAALFHDIIYNPASSYNERDSAGEWATYSAEIEPLAKLRINDFEETLVYDMINATADPSIKRTGVTNYFLDLDLSILGADPLIYDEYEQNVRLEYRHVPDSVFYPTRKAIMNKIANSEIYKTEEMQKALGEKAKANLARYGYFDSSLENFVYKN